MPFQELKTLQEFQQFTQSQKGLLLIDFTATWCGPCKRIKPLIEQLAEEYKTLLTVATVDGDANDETVSECKVTCYPTFQFYLNSKKLGECKGANIECLKVMLTKFLVPDTEKGVTQLD